MDARLERGGDKNKACEKRIGGAYIMTVTLLGYTLNLLSIVGILAAIVMIITEMVKELGIIKRIPTKLTALVISFVVVISAMIFYLNMAESAFVWWYLIAAFFASFIVGYLSMNGWDALYEIWKRFVPSGSFENERDDE